jgi:hypothetical protein
MTAFTKEDLLEFSVSQFEHRFGANPILSLVVIKHNLKPLLLDVTEQC